jgi:hypothetical protein
MKWRSIPKTTLSIIAFIVGGLIVVAIHTFFFGGQVEPEKVKLDFDPYANIIQPSRTPNNISSNISIAGNPILWHGSIADRRDLLRVWNYTAACVHREYRSQVDMSYPVVIEVENPVIYRGSPDVAACDLDRRIIYIQRNPNQGSEAEFLAHEIVHVITNIGDEGHSLSVFEKCGEAVYMKRRE